VGATKVAAVRLRPMELDDIAPVNEVMFAAFDDLAQRLGEEPDPPPPAAWADLRVRHFVENDPGGAWVAEIDGRVVGAALASRREGIWGLSLLVVEPKAQAAGIGRGLLERTLAYGDGARGGIILATLDPRALRSYQRAGFDFHPTAGAGGIPQPLVPPATVREGDIADLGLTEAVDRAVRGAAHGADIATMLKQELRMLVVGDRGYAMVREGRTFLLAARDEEAARDLLRAAIATTPDGRKATVYGITSRQAWALDIVLEAGLKLELWGAQFLRGDVGRFSPYLPSGAYL
jgi:GNAT superfamily N-acetyltransferase